MARRKVTYKEGDWIAVPLDEGGYAIGKIARVGKARALFGYFFGPRFDRMPTADDVKNIKITDYIHAVIFSDMGLREGEWKVIDRPERWNREEWPMLDFVLIEPIMGTAVCIRYAISYCFTFAEISGSLNCCMLKLFISAILSIIFRLSDRLIDS